MSDLKDSIYVAIRTAPKYVRTGLSARLANDGDRAASELTDLVMAAIRRHEARRDQAPLAGAPSSGQHFDQDAASDPAQNKPAG